MARPAGATALLLATLLCSNSPIAAQELASSAALSPGPLFEPHPDVLAPLAAEGAPLPVGAPERRPLRPTWKEVAVGTGVLVAVALDDEGLEEELYDDRPEGFKALAKGMSGLGSTPAGFAFTGLVWGAARFLDNEDVAHGAGRAALGLLATTLTDQVLKVGFGRTRPQFTDDAADFHPFSFDREHHSFPSGHAATAFSLATSVASEVHRPWMSVAAYGTAGTVAYARVYRHRHWPSDVIGGALLGTFATRATLHWLWNRRIPVVDEPVGDRSTSEPPRLTIGPRGVALTLAVP